MKISIAFYLMVISFSANSQQKDSLYTFKEIGWNIAMPFDFEVADNQKAQEATQRGLGLVRDATVVKGDLCNFKVMIYAKKGVANMFQVSLEDFPRGTESGYKKVLQHVKDLLYATCAKKMPNATLDSVSTIQKIDGLDFDQFDIQIQYAGKGEIHSIILSKLYKGYDLGISYTYVDETTKQEIKTILKNSRFDK